MRRLFAGLSALATASCLAAFSATAIAEPLNYDYIYLSQGETRADNGQEESGTVLGMFYSFFDSMHGFASYDEGGSYSVSGGDSRSIRAGLGGHFLLGENLMIAPAFALLRTEVDQDTTTTMRQPQKTTRPDHLTSDSDVGYILQLDVRWNFASRWELIGGLHRTEIFDQSSNEIAAGLLWHPYDWLAVGAIGKDKSEATATELTARWYF